MFNFNFGGFPGGGHPHGGGGGGGGGGGPRRRGGEVDNNKYYEILGLEKTATDGDIKKAFRKQAMQHHPDKGGDPEKFKEISKAYEVLNDPEKKALYDEGGEDALEGGGGGGHHGGGMDIFDLFGGGFGGGGPHRGGGGGKRKGDDVVFPLKVSLEDLYNGTSKKLRLTKNVLCTGCAGKGGSKEATCRACKGQGVRIVIRQLGPGMIQQMQTACGECSGTGSTMAEKDKCKKCKGEKTVKEKKTLEVFVNKGMRQGEKIVFAGEADESPDMTAGDVVVVLQLTEHSLFKRDGAHLFLKHEISLVEALTGFQFPIPHLDGRTLIVKSDPGMIIKPGDIKAIKDEGFPQLKNPYLRGNLYVEFSVKFPESGSFSDSARAALLNVLPAPEKNNEMETQSTGGETTVEEVQLVSVDINEEKKKFESTTSKEAYEEDEDGAGRGRPQAGCRTQ